MTPRALIEPLSLARTVRLTLLLAAFRVGGGDRALAG
jgi:hypothetical protein